MRSWKSYLAVGAVAAAGIAGATVYVNSSPGDGIQESAPRAVASAPVAPHGAEPPASGHGAVPYFESLPEPDESVSRANAPSNPPAKAQDRNPASLVLTPKDGEARAAAEEASPDALPAATTGGDCKSGARPLGDCNCYDEKAAKITLTLHPTNACIEAESKRLGHKVIVTDESGKMELAGTYPERPVENTVAPDPQSAAPVVQAQAAPSAAEIAEMMRANSILPPSSYFPPEDLSAPAAVKSHAGHAHASPQSFRAIQMPRITRVVPGKSVYQGLVQGETARLMMSRCVIPGHGVHVSTGHGVFLHIRSTAPLSGLLAHYRDLVLSGGAREVIVFSNRALIFRGGAPVVENLASPYREENYAAMPGFDDSMAASAYAGTLHHPPAPPSQAGAPPPIHKRAITTRLTLGKK